MLLKLIEYVQVTVGTTSADMTTIFLARSSSMFVETKHNLKIKKTYIMKQDTKEDITSRHSYPHIVSVVRVKM